MHTDMENGTKDAVTGLAAFDDLDPISTVSALNLMPELEPPVAPSRPTMRPSVRGGRSLPPPPPTASRAPASLQPPSMRPSSASAAPGVRSVPPPPPTASRPVGVHSVPPPVPARASTNMEMFDEPEAEASDFDQAAPTQSFSRPSDVEPAQLAALPVRRAPAAASRRTPGDDTGLLELSATTVATDIDMDWDDEEMVTKMRDETPSVNLRVGRPLTYDDVAPQVTSMALSAGPALISVGGRPSPFPPPLQGAQAAPYAVSVPPPGRLPSAVPTSYEDDAATRVRARSSISSAPQPVLRPFVGTLPAEPTAVDLEQWPEARPSLRKPLWLAAGVVGAALLFFAARALFGAPETGTVTLAAEPRDATVEVDGRPLTGQTSPFSLQGLTPGIDHELRVSRPGYDAQTLHFVLEPGEVKALPEVSLAELPSGFAIDSVPGGARILVDGQALAPVTPARISDLSAGLHTLRLELDGYAAWETQVIVSEHEMMALPTASLVRVEAAAAQAVAAAAPAAPEPAEVAAVQTSPRKVSAREKRKAARAARRAAKHASAKPSRSAKVAVAPRPRIKAPAAAPVSGKFGILRINSRPWSQIFVDGRPAGNTPQMSLKLAAGTHEVKLVNKQMGMQKKFSVSIAAGKTATKIVNLID
jgi:hypothetical protein